MHDHEVTSVAVSAGAHDSGEESGDGLGGGTIQQDVQNGGMVRAGLLECMWYVSLLCSFEEALYYMSACIRLLSQKANNP